MAMIRNKTESARDIHVMKDGEVVTVHIPAAKRLDNEQLEPSMTPIEDSVLKEARKRSKAVDAWFDNDLEVVGARSAAKAEADTETK